MSIISRLLLVYAVPFYTAFVATKIWGWYLVAFAGLPPLHFMAALGVCYLWTLLANAPITEEDEALDAIYFYTVRQLHGSRSRAGESLRGTVARISVFLLVAWIVQYWYLNWDRILSSLLNHAI